MAIKPQTGGGQPGNTTAQDLVGSAVAGLDSRISLLESGLQAITSSVNEPEIDLSFTPIFRLDNKGAWVTIAIKFPPGTIELKVLMVITALRTSQAAFETASFHVSIKDLQPDEIAAGRVVRELNKRLYFNTQYDIYRLKAFTLAAGAAAEVSNPEGDILYTDVALLQFTTPDLFGVPSSPAAGLIKNNGLDLKTREHDAYVVLRVWAPTTQAGAAQTWTASGCNELVPVVRRDDVSPTILIRKHIQVTTLDTLVDAASTPVANRGYIEVLYDNLRVGGDYSWLRNVAYTNGEKKESTGPLVSFIGGNLGVDPSTLTSLSLTIADTDPYDAKHRFVTLNLTQPAAVVALKHLKIRVKIQGAADATYITRVAKFTLRDDEWHTAGAKVIPVKALKLKHNKNYTLEVTITALGGLTRVFTQDTLSGADEDVPNDTAVPNSLAAPVIDWTAAGRLRIRGMNFGAASAATAQTATLKKKWLLVYDGSTTYLDIAARAGGGSLAGSLLEIGLKSHITLTDIKKKIFKTVFGASGNFVAAWYAENEIGLSSQSADSNILNVANLGETLADDKDAVNVVDIGVMLNSPQQMLTNGDWLFNSGVAGTANGFRKYTATPGADSAVTDNTANDIYWDKDNHQGIWKNNASRLHQPLKKRLKKGQFYSVALLLKTDGSFGSGTIVISIVNSDDSSASASTFSINLALLTSSYQLFGGTIQCDTASDYTANKFLKFVTAATLSGTNNIINDAVMMVRGKVAFAFTPRSSQYEGDATDPGTAENITLATINNVAAPDLGNPSGSQGGFEPTGGRLDIGTL